MRILFLTQNFQPEPMFKGFPLADAFRRLGHDVEVLTTFPNYPGGKIYSGYRQSIWKKDRMGDVDVNRVPIIPSHSRSGLRRVICYSSFGLSSWMSSPWVVRKPDVIHIYNLVTLVPTARLLRFIYGAKIVLDVQDLWPESIASSGMMKSKLILGLLNKICIRQYRAANRLVTLSPGFKDNLVGRGVPGSKIDVVYNWCDEGSIKVPSPNVEESRRLGFEGRFNIVFAGTMGVIQALDCVIEAARELQNSVPQVLFTFVGAGNDVDRLKSLAHGLNNVQFLPAVPQSEVGSIFSNSDVLLVHLKDDAVFRITIPSKVQAYMHAGKPILCGVPGDASRLVEESKAGLNFHPENAGSLVKAVKTLVTMKRDDLIQMGNSSKSFYESSLSMSVGVARLQSVFEQACS